MDSAQKYKIAGHPSKKRKTRKNLIIVFVIVGIIVIFFSVATTSFSIDEDHSTLQLVQILFRHGDRTNMKLAMYPNDPYINETFYPYGLEQLTNKGKVRMFNVGQTIRKRYHNFLDKLYQPSLVSAYSSHKDRCKASMQLVLAGLFPPVDELIWNKDLLWQPIPFYSFNVEDNLLFTSIMCSSYNKLYWEYIKTPPLVEQHAKYKDIFAYISKHTGWNVTTIARLFLLYGGLKSEEGYGLKLPDWTKKVYPKILEKAAKETLMIYCGTTEMRRYSAGVLLKKFVDEIQDKIAGRKSNKIILYAGHEFNLAGVLFSLGLYENFLPPYGSYVAIELHKVQGTYGLKFYYDDGLSPEPKLLKKNGKGFWPVEELYDKAVEYYPVETCTLIPYNF